MTYTPISKGTTNWDVPLNSALAQLDATISSNNSNALQAANNLSDVPNKPLARNNLGISAGVAQGVNSFNVKDYGAIGNGTADDTVAVQNAINAAQTAGGGQVYFPAGKYKLNSSSPLNVTSSFVTFAGSGNENTQILIGSGFTGSSAITVSGNYFTFKDMSLDAASSTTTSNPACHGITGTGAQTFRVFNATFLNINGYAIQVFGTAGTSLHGGSIRDVKIQNTAGAIYIKSDNTNNAANFTLSNVFTRFIGENSGTNANLDCIRIEDSWDVLCQNVFAWMNATTGGTGVAFRVIGNCAATFVQNLDALGPQTGAANVSIESNANGSPQNVQIAGGVIQQGNVGLNIAGSSNQIRVRNMRILNNQTHNIVVSTNGSGSTTGIYLDQLAISQGGQVGTGTNYDINWTGTADGFITECRFGSTVVASGSGPGIQGMVNNSGGAVLRVTNFTVQSGNGYTATNWFSGTNPQFFNYVSGTNNEYRGNLDMRLTGTNRLSMRADTATSNAIAFNVAGTASADNCRIAGDGTIAWGDGTGGVPARDVTWGRQAATTVGTPDSDIQIGLAGKTLKIKNGGTNAKAGTVQASGTALVDVPTTSVTANSTIILSYKSGTQAAGGTAWVAGLVAGSKFQIKSLTGDSAIYNWVIIEQV